MTHYDDVLDARIRTTLRAVLDAESGPHARWEDAPVRATILARPRSHRGTTLRLLAVAALLAVGGGTAALVGFRPVERDLTRTLPESIPAALQGQWSAGSADQSDVYLEIGGPPLPGFPDLRRATGYIPLDPDRGILVIAPTRRCPENRYLVTGVWQGRLELTVLGDECPGGDSLTGRTLDVHQATAPASPRPNDRMDSLLFTEPFTIAAAPINEHPFTIEDGPDHGSLRIRGFFFWIAVFDDVALYRDASDPSGGTLADIPTAPAEFAAWLRSNSELPSAEPTTVDIDGRTALRFETATDHRGGDAMRVPGPNLYGNLRLHQYIYLLPTPRDTVMVAVRGDMDSDRNAADELLRSITFR